MALVDEYNQPSPQPSDAMVKKVGEFVTQLNADDWKARDRAETQLVGMGQSIVGTLRQLRGAQTPEAQQRIDSVLTQLGKTSANPTSAPSSGTTPGANVDAPPAVAPNAPPAALPQLEIIKG